MHLLVLVHARAAFARLVVGIEDDAFTQPARRAQRTVGGVLVARLAARGGRVAVQMLEANQVDGIISGSHNLGIEDYNRVTAPIISFDRNLSPDIPVVSSDNYGGGVLAAQTLVKAGAQNIIMISAGSWLRTSTPT